MEAFGIAIALLAGVVAAPIFCFVLVRVVRRFPLLALLGYWVAVPLLSLFLVEVTLVSWRGVLFVRALVGPAFYFLHVLLTFAAAPALACLLLLGQRSIKAWWPAAAALCWVLGACAIFYHENVAETLYGVDSHGGPYQSPW